jgi:hypothetical protein
MEKSLLRYSMLIEWSEEDQAYLITLPEWAERVMCRPRMGTRMLRPLKTGKRCLNCL